MAKKRQVDYSAQWKHVREARARIDSENFPIPSALEEAWKVLDEHYGTMGDVSGDATDRRRLLDRDTLEGKSPSSSPLEVLMFLLDMGFYPPPELLLGVKASWHEYLDAGGRASLEEVFLGKPIPKAGNYAARDEARRRRIQIFAAFLYARRAEPHKKKREIADVVIKQLGLTHDPEYVIRIAKEFPGAVKVKK